MKQNKVDCVADGKKFKWIAALLHDHHHHHHQAGFLLAGNCHLSRWLRGSSRLRKITSLVPFKAAVEIREESQSLGEGSCPVCHLFNTYQLIGIASPLSRTHPVSCPD
ncbi:hypothetical protein H5410_008480 [Solanum commersonii]|uniref:Uncharacterized protein n=1 Tax=Solanum commersonii TaxID=4109 RepID=A0A9J6AF12_SOLCO|nr:hypothetical protein H5410_008480 [Solanum commersonii]